MAITTVDGIVNAISNGNAAGTGTTGAWHQPWQKQTGASAYTAGRWYDLAGLAGLPPAETFAGTTGTAVAFTNSSPGWMPIGGTGGLTVSPSIRNLIANEVLASAATGVPAWLMLVDMLLYYPTVSLSASTASLTNTVTLANMTYPRYTTGAGVMAYFTVGSGSTSASPTMYLTYTNSGGTGSRSTLTSLVANGSTSIVPQIVYSGTSINNYGPFFPLQAGDLGVQSVQSVTLSGTTGATSGTLVLCKPLAQIPITTQYIATGRDFVFNMPSMPIIYDGAYLNFLLFAGANVAASSNFVATLDYIWG